MKRLLTHSVLLILSFAAVIIWQKAGLSEQVPIAIGLLSIVYLIFAFHKKGNAPHRHTITVVLLTIMTLLLIFSTGGFSSLLFFLLYFLSFTIAFTLEPESIFVFAILVVLIFLPESISGDLLPNLLKISSFILLCPIAYFFGKEIRFQEKEANYHREIEKETEEAANTIVKDVSDMVINERGNLKEEDLNKLQDIVRQTKKIKKDIKNNKIL